MISEITYLPSTLFLSSFNVSLISMISALDILVFGSLLSFSCELAKLHKFEVQRQAFMSSYMLLILHLVPGIIGLSTGPNTKLDGSKQSRTTPRDIRYVKTMDSVYQVFIGFY